jgi:hypothetical protein
VRRVVRGQGPDELKVIDDSVVELIPEADRSALHGILIAEIRGLHEGTVSRYRLTLGEWRRWIARRISV